MKKINKVGFFYLLIRRYLLFVFKRFYSKVIIVGKENLPNDNDAVIFAPNHLNALMDALAILLLLKKNKAAVFLARSDLFNSKFISSILYFAKILPAYRKIDGIENLNKNNDIFELCVETLNQGLSIGMMPEGGQGEQHRIRPLVKGIFRIAFEAQRQFGSTKKVKIVPIGLDMGDLKKSNHHLIINIGKPIDIQEHIEDYNKNPSVAINTTKKILYQSLSSLTLNIASAEYYETIKFISDVEGYKFKSEEKDKNQILSQFHRKKEVTNTLLRIQRDEPLKMKSIEENVKLLREKMNKLKLTPAAFTNEKKSLIEIIFGFPIFLFGFTTNALPTFVPVWIRKIIGIEYDGFYSSIQLVLGLITFPAFYVLQTILFCKFMTSNIWLNVIFLCFQFFSRNYALRWWKNYKKARKQKIFRKNKQLQEIYLPFI